MHPAHHAETGIAPEPHQWSFELISHERRDRLEQDRSFETLLDEIVGETAVITASVEPGQMPPKEGPQKLSRIEFRLVLAKPVLVDEFFNGRRGLRGQYWCGPDVGDDATRLLIGALRERLLGVEPVQKLGRYGWRMEPHDVAKSLSVGSAKVWVAERDADGKYLVDPDNVERLVVARWRQNEQGKKRNWRWTPATGDLDIKGGLISPEHEEWVPDDKRDRADSIRCFGWS